MKNKTQRLLAIRKIVSSGEISNQEEILDFLIEEGFQLTQATLSRDLKFLGVGKKPDREKGYVYVLPDDNNDEKIQYDKKIPLMGFKKIVFSHNLAVIKTLPGYASSLASMIDSIIQYEIIGTIAGDDTVLLIPSEGATHQDVINALALMMPELEEKLYQNATT